MATAHPRRWFERRHPLLPVLAGTGALILACGGDGRDTGEGLIDGGEYNADCYEDTTVGCTDLSWSDVKGAIEIVFLQEDEYFGYSRSEALDYAEDIYNTGLPAVARARILSVQDLGGGQYRAWVSVTGEDGLPAGELGSSDFDVSVDGGTQIAPDAVSQLTDADADDLDMAIAVVVDDSGSIEDCDANFIGAGLGVLFESLPPVYQAQLIKFDRDVVVMESWTRDGDALADAALYTCTERGATAVWDAAFLALTDLPPADLTAVVVLSDGLDNMSARDVDAVVDKARDLQTPVLAIGLGYADIFAMSELGEESGGAFVYVPSGQQTIAAFETVADFVQYTYAVEFSADSGWDSIEVDASVDGRSVSDTWRLGAVSSGRTGAAGPGECGAAE